MDDLFYSRKSGDYLVKVLFYHKIEWSMIKYHMHNRMLDDDIGGDDNV